MEIKDLSTEQLEKMANMLKAIAHPMRIAILSFIEEDKKLTVTEIHNLLKPSASILPMNVQFLLFHYLRLQQ